MMAFAPAPSKFLLEFRIQDDGLDSARAQHLASERTEALRGDGDAHSKFTCFPELPPELRLKVWDYLITPRIVQIFCLPDIHPGRTNGRGTQTNSIGDDHNYDGTFDIDFTIDDYHLPDELHDPSNRQHDASLIPLLLHINREARHHGLKHYELAFSWKVPHVLADLDIGTSGRRSSPPSWSEPRIYFNFALDAVHLAGELEPCDSYGFNSPMTYFLRKEDCLRVRHVALSFGALHYGATASQQIFGSLFHVVDRFSPPHGRVLVTVSDRDEGINLMIGAASPLVPPAPSSVVLSAHSSSALSREGITTAGPMTSGGLTAMEREYASRPQAANTAKENVVQKLWSDWYRGSSVKSHLANMRFDLIHDWDLAEQIAQLDGAMATRDLTGRDNEQSHGPIMSEGAVDGDRQTLGQMTNTNFYEMEEDYSSIPAELRL
ncbi:uncharacterized protein B0I36DRAFT_10318 [Microdochium trichocladiopsis]|uniref:2EXR domain-containing protein n=1 Tax=Microdochium trichocladiopsis TaxID=1682393 RepID=A0A9P8YK07_9PEZI|nr:uncharacterized protein B0I36DRAFT_10318 [Microdochium trichocladiopsis]KAH7040434.1 hypothetical protein B0I36DRAFT_10318 [Microdochium trichocladiopsis]